MHSLQADAQMAVRYRRAALKTLTKHFSMCHWEMKDLCTTMPQGDGIILTGN
jgi:hypothetical protein